MEKDAVLFYSEPYRKTGSEKVKEALSRLLEEEKKHLVEFARKHGRAFLGEK